MYLIKRTKSFEKSFKKLERSGKLALAVKESLLAAIDTIASGIPLPAHFRDHRLNGALKEYRECHIKGDLLLVYQIQKMELVVILVDIGSHSYLNI